MDYTYDQWKLAQEWAEQEERDTDNGLLTDTVLGIVRSLPEPKRPTFADVPEKEQDKYIGCAVEAYGERGWVVSSIDEYDYDCLVVTLHDGLLDCRSAEPYEVILLPDEPRMVIPGLTQENETKKEPNTEPRKLKSVKDFEDAPDGTVVIGKETMLYKTESKWQACGYNTNYYNREACYIFSPVEVIRWG